MKAGAGLWLLASYREVRLRLVEWRLPCSWFWRDCLAADAGDVTFSVLMIFLGSSSGE